jgi:hypothetical protein
MNPRCLIFAKKSNNKTANHYILPGRAGQYVVVKEFPAVFLF